MALEELKLKEINLFLDLARTSSVREVARQRNMQAGQVSKWIQSLEHKLGTTLLERSNQGVQLTPAAQELLPRLEEIGQWQERVLASKKQEEHQVLTFASVSFFSSYFLPEIFAKLGARQKLNLRLVELAPTQLVPVALRGAFQVALHTQQLDWPQTWTTVQVGTQSWHLVCRKGHPVLQKPTQAAVLKYPFVYPLYWTQEGLRHGKDQCPLPLSKRIKGHATATASSAREIVRLTDQLAFLPDLVIRSALRQGELELVPLDGLKQVSFPVYLTVKNELVTQKNFDLIHRFCREELSRPLGTEKD